MDIPTDCPTRERAGWTGDAQLYSKTASLFMNVMPFFEKWLADLAAEQYPSGAVGSTVPNVLGFHNTEEWERISPTVTHPKLSVLIGNKPGEPSIIRRFSGLGRCSGQFLPWTLYLCYGDRSILEKQYNSAKAWVEYMRANAKLANERYKDSPAYSTYTDGELDADYIWDTKYHWGESLEADINIQELNHDYDERASISEPIVATAYYAFIDKAPRTNGLHSWGNKKMRKLIAHICTRRSRGSIIGILSIRMEQSWKAGKRLMCGYWPLIWRKRRRSKQLRISWQGW